MTDRSAAGTTFDDFVAARSTALWRSAFLLTGDRHKAEDLLQVALVKTWRRWDRLTGGVEPAEAYVRRALVTTYTDWWRRRWRGEVPTGELPERPTTGRDGPGAVDVRRDVLTALAGLSRGQRAVLVLRYFDDLTEQQTADVLGVSRGTVKSQASRALAALRSSPALTDHDHPATEEEPS
ncbi:SigE family RNA polymerase sigma factor [Nocardioides litoris]|uniref:SigE family RNA polymerase sigma factor n=1 Tax=Nocardioides litoris TaxID=1926648 RepID=UPI00111EE5E3|nr:SigE family RNA polymerase sigma factor [Nocardioides litoris]